MPSFLETKKKGDVCGDFEGMMCLVLRCSSTKALQVSISRELREYIYFGNLQDEHGLEVNGVVIGLVWGKDIMGFLEEDIFKVLAPFGVSLFWSLGVLSNLSGNGDLSNGFSGEPFHLSFKILIFLSASNPNHQKRYLCGTAKSVVKGRHSQGGTTSLF